jgi:ribosomal protein L37AE/L43A
MNRPRDPEDVRPPTECPFCRSHDITTSGAKLSPGTYWRCTACGQVWHPARLQPVPSYPHSYRR